jgi:hypothetical protein
MYIPLLEGDFVFQPGPGIKPRLEIECYHLTIELYVSP